MPRKFSDNPSQRSRAVQIWQILIAKAHNHQILNFNELGELVGYWGNRVGQLTYPLNIINQYCIQEGLPRLPCLVVSFRTGRPTRKLNWSGVNLNTERGKIFRFEWFKIYPPSEDDYQEIFSWSYLQIVVGTSDFVIFLCMYSLRNSNFQIIK